MGNCKGQCYQKSLSQTNNIDCTKLVIIVKTWQKDAFSLFDYENATNAQEQKFIINTGGYLVGRNQIDWIENDSIIKDELCKIKKKNEDYFIVNQNFQNIEQQQGIQEKEEYHTIVNKTVQDKIGNKIWKVIHENGILLQEEDVIKFGRVKFTIRQIELNIKPQEQRSECESSQSNGSEQIMCRSPKNPLLNPCKCSGSIKYIHLECLKTWLRMKLENRQSENCIVYLWKNLECELCKYNYPPKFKSDDAYNDLVELSKPNDYPYLMMEFTNKQGQQLEWNNSSGVYILFQNQGLEDQMILIQEQMTYLLVEIMLFYKFKITKFIFLITTPNLELCIQQDLKKYKFKEEWKFRLEEVSFNFHDFQNFESFLKLQQNVLQFIKSLIFYIINNVQFICHQIYIKTYLFIQMDLWVVIIDKMIRHQVLIIQLYQMNVYISEYHVLSYLGSGSGHLVMKVQHNQTFEILAMKIEKSAHLGQIEAEVQKLQHLKGIIGIPQLLDYGINKDSRVYMITPIMKINLQEILKDNSMTISQILAIGLCILEVLEQVHKQNILHLDIKPENIMFKDFYINFPVEYILKPGFIQLIDFGLSQKAGLKISQNKYFVGSLRYASRQAHKGNQLHFKDDLESLLYMLVYLRTKKLPWQSDQQYKSYQIEIRKIGEVKEAVFNTEVLTQNFPQLFTKFKTYIDELTYMEMPDYNYLKLLFRQMLKLENFSNSYQNKSSFSYSNLFKENNKIQNSEKMILSVRNLYNKNSLNCEEDLFDTETSVVQISDMVKTYNTQIAKSIVDIKFDSKCS